ncbi:MAG: hypothetical protein R6U29_10995 [Desulfosudaceae bacterium]
MRVFRQILMMPALLVLLAQFPLVGLSSPAAAGPEPTLAIIPLAIHADQDLTYLTDGATDMMASRIAAEADVRVLDSDTVKSAAQGLEPPLNRREALAVGEATGADQVLYGTITRLGQTFSLDINVLDMTATRAPASFYGQAGSLDEIVPAVNAIARDISRSVFAADLPAPAASSPEVKPEPTTGRKDASESPVPLDAHPETLLKQSGTSAAAGAAAGTAAGTVAGKATGSATSSSPRRDIAAGDGKTDSSFIRAQSTRQAADFWKSRDFETELCGLAVADLTGDGRQETVLLSENNVVIRRLEKGRFYKLAERQAPSHQRFLAVDAVDTDANGKAEIFISALNLNSGKTASLVLELSESGLSEVAADQDWLFKSMGAGHIYGQKKGRSSSFSGDLAGLFSGGVWRLKKEGPDYVKQERINIPERFNLFAVTLGDARNDGATDLVAADDKDRLRLYDNDGRRLWTSNERYGGSETYLTVTEDSDNQIGERLYLPRPVLIADVNADDRREVLTIANTPATGRLFSRFRHYTQASFACLAWDGLGLAELWRTRPVSGYAADLALADMNNDGQKELVGIIVSAREAAFSSPRSSVISYDLDKIR